MKILQIGKTYPLIGGVDKVIFELSLGFSRNQIRCDVLCASIDRKTHTIHQNAFSTIYAISSLGSIASTWISPGMILKLRKIIQNYDIIHIHHPDPMAALALLLCSNIKEKKIVLHWHSDIVKQKLLLKLYFPLQNWLLKRADKIIATSPIYAENSIYLKPHLKKVEIIPIGVEVNHDLDITLETKIKSNFAGKKIIYSLGRLCYYKGFEYLIDAAKYLDDSYVVLIGGGGPLKKDLALKISQSDLQNKVFLLGRIDDKDMATYFATSTIFCLPSIEKSEAFGIVQIEAMSFGKPIIATNIPESGVSWVNKHGDSGLNVEPKDAIGLAQAIMDICENEESLNKYSANSLKRFSDEFTVDRMTTKVLGLYKELQLC